MTKNVFISFRFNDGKDYKKEIVEILEKNPRIIDFSEDVDRNGYSEEYIREFLYKKIRKTSVTIVLLTPDAINHKKNILGDYDDWMYDEIRYSLEDREQNRTSGLLAVYTKEAEQYLIGKSTHTCEICNETKTCTSISTFDNLIRKNMFNIKPSKKHNKCDNLFDSEWDHYCQLVSYEDFITNVDKYIDIAYEKKLKVDDYVLCKSLEKQIV